ncbi:MAG: ABC transporter permease [Bdellovibrionales bacterium]|nr:ABC transporter permease [Bdellovibrionales bacterium]
MIRSIYALVWREGLRFYRQKGRLFATLLTPLLFWLVMGNGFGNLFENTSVGMKSINYFFPGILVMSVLFSSVFSMISVIEDRNEGFLQGVRLVPYATYKIVLGKIVASSVWALIQALLLLLLAPLANIQITAGMWFEIGFILLIAAIFMSALGFVFAWWLNSVQGFHGIMNIVLFPLWVLSGAIFPYESAKSWVYWIMRFNPLRFVVQSLQEVLFVQYSIANFFSSPKVIWLVFFVGSASVMLIFTCIALVGRPDVRK